jgi:uncharacterized membrane protein
MFSADNALIHEFNLLGSQSPRLGAAGHFTLGMRGYYFAVPLTLWLFGPIWLLLGGAGLTAALHRHDHAA